MLSAENHEWFHKQSKKAQRQMNELFQQYKESAECKVEFVDDLDMPFSIASTIIVPAEMEKRYNRAREKREWKKEIEEEERNL